MMVVSIDIVEGVFGPTQKRDLIERVTAAAVSVGGELLRQKVWVRIHETAPGDLAIGGAPIGGDALPNSHNSEPSFED